MEIKNSAIIPQRTKNQAEQVFKDGIDSCINLALKRIGYRMRGRARYISTTECQYRFGYKPDKPNQTHIAIHGPYHTINNNQNNNNDEHN